jgi:hypothetical protein
MILNRFFPADGRSFQYAAWGVVLLALVHMCWLQLRPESELHQICALAAPSPTSRAIMVQYQQLDRIGDRIGDGNVLLKLAGYAKKNPVVETSLSFIYFRASYALYPRRIYIAPADKVINNGWDIMRIKFNPSRQWLQEHDVRSVFTYGNIGGVKLRLEPLPPSYDQAGMPADKSGGN